jgi:D-sedoheptulose 7-phosphate isomerase
MMNIREMVKNIFGDSLRVKEQFLSDDISMDAVAEAASTLVECYRRGGKVIVFGNGGSAADSQHMAAELLVRFEKDRKGLPCVALTANTSVMTAVSNDYGFKETFSRQIEALAAASDAVVAISTSGDSENVLEGVKAARAKKIPVITLTGKDGGKLPEISDVSIVVRSENTARIQEIHITVIHVLCKIIEDALFGAD